jgi:lysophospholipase L1-like esterase
MADSVQTLRQVATGTHIPNALATGSLTTSFSRTPHILRSVVAALAIVLPNWYVAGQTETNAGSTIWTAAIEYPAGTFTRVTFGGAASVTSSGGGNIVSDMIPVAIPKGEKFWVRLFQNAPSKVIYFNFYCGDGTAQFISPATDMTMGGSATVCNSAFASVTLPIAIIGMSADPAIGIYGDSISVGRGDTADAGIPLQGHLGRAFGASYAAGHVGVSGDRMAVFLTNRAKRMSLASYFTHFAVNMGINDITNGGSASSVAADTNTIVGLFPGPVALCTLSPISTSTDTWNSVAAQTTVASNGVRVTENTRRLGGISGVRTVYDVNPSVESVASPESGLWRASAYTADGTHPSAKGYKEEAAAINVALLTASEQPPAQDGVIASTVAESRRVAFPGGTRVVAFGTVPGAVTPNAPFLEAGRWWSEKHPLDERYWVADITIDLDERATTAKSVERIVAGVTVLEEPVIQGKLIPVKLGGFNAATGAINYCTFRVTCANGERFDRTIWFKQPVGTWWINKDADDQSYYVADIGNDLIDSGTTATAVKAFPVGVVELVPAVIQGPLILVKLGGMDSLPAGVNYCDFRIDCANGERFYRSMQFNRVDN